MEFKNRGRKKAEILTILTGGILLASIALFTSPAFAEERSNINIKLDAIINLEGIEPADQIVHKNGILEISSSKAVKAVSNIPLMKAKKERNETSGKPLIKSSSLSMTGKPDYISSAIAMVFKNIMPQKIAPQRNEGSTPEAPAFTPNPLEDITGIREPMAFRISIKPEDLGSDENITPDTSPSTKIDRSGVPLKALNFLGNLSPTINDSIQGPVNSYPTGRTDPKLGGSQPQTT